MVAPMRQTAVLAERVERLAAVPTPPRVAESVRDLAPYDPVSSLDRIASRPNEVAFKLDWNEATVAPSPRVITAIQAFLNNTHNLNWYPDLNSRRLVTKLQTFLGVPAEHLVVTNGSDDALNLVCQAYLDPGDEVVVPVPTYTHFLVFAEARGGIVRQVPGDDPFQPDVDAVLDCVTPRTKLIYLVSPNNPTGTVYPPEEVERVSRMAPGAIVIVDEAYFEFCGTTSIHLATRLRNVVVTRTFSKSWGLAGLRVGYLAACAEVIGDLKRVFNPKSVNVLGQVAAAAALDDVAYLDWYVSQVSASKALLTDFFAKHNMAARSTPANFILVEADDPAAFVRALEGVNIYIRDRSRLPRMERYVRMSVGTVEQSYEIMRRISQALGWQ